ncbi:MAG: RsmB/NOP family class I SAM-dependent RNA methyltransferase [Nanoarchaeota archaeon]
MRPEMKPLFEERMRKLLPDEEEFDKYSEIIHTKPLNYIRCNTLKISCDKLFMRLREKWNVVCPFPKYPEIILIDQELGPGELGNSIEHLLGYYYVQEVCSMMSVIALNPAPGERVLDLCASPGSKTTQIAALMENSGTIIANDIKLDRLKILSANLERCGVMNCVSVRNDGVGLCSRLAKEGWKFDKILLDAPCSGEGTLRSSPKTFLMWNIKVVEKLSREQRKLIANALKCLKVGGTLVYSTCTHSPEENEAVVDFALKNFPVELEELHLPLRCRPGVTSWNGSDFSPEVSRCCRIYPQDNNSEGFFVAKLRLLEEVK